MVASSCCVLPTRFATRADAGRALGERLLQFTTPPSIVLGIPHGGVAVAAAVAAILGAPLCAAWVRKIVVPKEPAIVFGAVDLSGDLTVATESVRAAAIDDETLAELAYHAHRDLLSEWERTPGLDAASLLPGATAILVDDAICTGLSLRAALRWARHQFPRSAVVAVPIVDVKTWHRIAGDADRAVTLEERPDGPVSRGDVYRDYQRLSAAAMSQLLSQFAGESARR